ncbi:cardiolipin synthase [Dysgonomonas sp. PH5-45]|uniref:cardiolipin synthase n=1 Tax=unclassified Dysgonomonas TaxID=2630389 RepID=UPI002475E0D2|nr:MULTISPECIES: cardiolipin synthase [unclassified Dysgonomonas]MDH6355027.1 cardiolipin synthase [Dysgonomonas sp. PH5-45]MDH6387927.1 cardiolipin synthase [Dysgonomonas sp. PH5-37]
MLNFFSADDAYLIFQMLYVITAIGVVIVVISENRNPLKTISWVLILLLLPLAGLVIYYFFGEDHRKRRLISRKMRKKLNKQSVDRNDMLETSYPPAEYKGLVSLLNKLKDTPLYAGSKITFYSDGKDKFDALKEELRKAQHHIHLQYYIFMDDKIGHEIRSILVEKARQGVEVRVLYDDVGSWKAKNRFFKEMAKEGVLVEAFLKVRFPLLTSRVNYRNHRKVVVVDGKVGFMGGMNIADRYIEGTNGGVWRDCHFKVEGKAVHGLQTSFAIDWYASRSEFLASGKYFPVLEEKGVNLMQIATSGPTGEFKEILQGIFKAIVNAKEYIYIQTPYFIPNDTLLLAIQTAAISGVEVKLMLPKKSDTTFVHIATLSYIKDLLGAKVKVYFFQEGFVHSKLMVIDDSLVISGSANMDVRSFEHNFEIDAFIYNHETAMEAKKIFETDMLACEQVDAYRWAHRPMYRRFASSVMRMLTPLL